MSDLIANGNFSVPTGVNPGGFKQFSNPPETGFKWTIAWVNPTTTGTPTAEVQNTAADGQYLELASSAPYQISQTVQPLPGQDYVFSFRAKARQGYPSPFLARLTKPNGVVVEYRIKPGPEWQTYTFCQCPGAREVVVTFVGLGTNDGGAFLDDVHYVN
jgi:hypothetical protein